MASNAHGESGGLQMHPLDQFEVAPAFGSGHYEWYTITNSAMWMLLTVVFVGFVFLILPRRQSVIPSRSQSIVETIYSFGHNLVEDNAGKDAMVFFPFVMTLFMFILGSNLLALNPYAFSPTSHIIVTAILALLVFVTVIITGIAKNGTKFLKLFWIDSAPFILRPMLFVIEVISFFVRPLSHSIRLGGNLMAGHILLKVFAAFAGVMGLFAFIPILTIAALFALETLVAGIQAYVFAILTCVYLHDALHPGH